MQIKKNYKTIKGSLDHAKVISKIQKSIISNKWGFILSELPSGSILVGGYIRDLILDRLSPYPDIDIVVPNNALDIGHNIASKFSGKFLILDQKKNIVRIIFREFIIDIANQTDNTTIEDLKKRDLTINSISFSFDSTKLIDPVNGLSDLNNSSLRCFKSENLIHDPLRMLRCFRFVSELNFKIQPDLLEFIEFNKTLLRNVAVERIQYELKKIVSGDDALKAILYINKLKIFDWIQSYEKNGSNLLKFINYEHFSLEEIKKYIPIVYLKEILSKEVIKEFKFSKHDANSINSLRKWSNQLNKKSIEEFTEIERFDLHKDLEEILPSFIFYLPSDYHENWLKRWRNKNDKLFHPRNFIDGNTLKTIVGIGDGPLLGHLINYLSREFAYERVNNFDEAIYKAKHWFQQNAPKYD